MDNFNYEKFTAVEKAKSKVLLLLFWIVVLLFFTVSNIFILIENFNEFNILLTAVAGASFLGLFAVFRKEYSFYKSIMNTLSPEELKEIEKKQETVNYNPNIPHKVVVIVGVILIAFICYSMYSYLKFLDSTNSYNNSNTNYGGISDRTEYKLYRLDNQHVKLGDNTKNIELTTDYKSLNSRVFINHTVSEDKIYSAAVSFILDKTVYNLYPLAYDTNVSFANMYFDSNNCVDNVTSYECSKDGISLVLNQNESIKVSDNEFVCELNENRESFCNTVE